MRAGSTSRSQSAAGNAKPCSSPSTALERLAPLAALGAEALPMEQEALDSRRASRARSRCAGASACSGGCARAAAARTTPRRAGVPVKLPAHRRALLLERVRAPAARRRRARPNGRASTSAVTGPSASKRLRTSSRSAASRSTAPAPPRTASCSAGDRARQRELELGQPLGADPHACRHVGSSTTVARPVGAQALEQRRPRRALAGRHETEQHQRVVQLVGIQHRRPRFARARARSLRGRACRARPLAPASCSGAPAPRACAAPRPARRRGTRRASRRGSLARAATGS